MHIGIDPGLGGAVACLADAVPLWRCMTRHTAAPDSTRREAGI